MDYIGEGLGVWFWAWGVDGRVPDEQAVGCRVRRARLELAIKLE